MKKLCTLLLVLGVILALPLDAFATSKAVIPKDAEKKVDNGDGTMTYYYPISLENSGEEAGADVPYTKIDLEFTYGPAITSFVCKGTNNYTVTQDGNATQTGCTFEADPGLSGAKVSFGQLVVIVKKDSPDEDCTIKYKYKGAESKITVETGSSIPYAMITGAVILGAAVYFATKKKTKLQRI